MDHWNALEDRLVAWQTGLTGIRNVLQATRQNAAYLAVPEAAS